MTERVNTAIANPPHYASYNQIDFDEFCELSDKLGFDPPVLDDLQDNNLDVLSNRRVSRTSRHSSTTSTMSTQSATSFLGEGGKGGGEGEGVAQDETGKGLVIRPTVLPDGRKLHPGFRLWLSTYVKGGGGDKRYSVTHMGYTFSVLVKDYSSCFSATMVYPTHDTVVNRLPTTCLL